MRILFLLIIVNLSAFAVQAQQSFVRIDSLCTRICDALQRDKDQPDTVRLGEIYANHFIPFLVQIAEHQRDSVVEFLHFRLQRNCSEYINIFNRLNPAKGDWRIVPERPLINLKKKECSRLLKMIRYWYRESDDGSITRVVIKDGYWLEYFADNTYSKLKFVRTNDCEFELEFLESNNRIRKNFSKPGDRYQYSLLEKGENYCLVLSEITGNSDLTTFKLYIGD